MLNSVFAFAGNETSIDKQLLEAFQKAEIQADTESVDSDSETADESKEQKMLTGSMSKKEIMKLKKKAMLYREWTESPLYEHHGKVRAIELTLFPVEIHCAVGYATLIRVPFDIFKAVYGSTDNFSVSILPDRRTVRIFPLKPFQASNIVILEKSDKDVPRTVSVFIKETLSKEDADYMVFFITPGKYASLTKENLIEIIEQGQSNDPVMELVRHIECQEGVLPLIRKCALKNPDYHLYMLQGFWICDSPFCDFKATVSDMDTTIIGAFKPPKACTLGKKGGNSEECYTLP